MSQVLVDSVQPTLPFWVNDVGQDDLFSITVKSGSSVLAGGTLMGKFSGGGSAHLKYGAYGNGHSDGTETAVGILYYEVDPRAGDVLGSLMVRGDVRSGSLIGFDSNAATDLAGRFFFV